MNLPKQSKLSDPESRVAFGEKLLAWYDEERRELPWRKDPSLYKTVVSEFMLQQTRVTTVLPYLERWLQQFPDFSALAAADEETVLKAWEGLGYYSRARNLRKLAKEIVALEEIPTDAKSWEGFPGIGPYVAAAVTSISFGKPVAVVDGNVVRVLSRLLSIDDQFRDGASAQRQLRPIAQDLINEDRPGDYNQALMELGATTCHRQTPLCTVCPVLQFCRSGSRGDAERFPRIAKRKIDRVTVERLWVVQDGCLLLRRTPSESKRLAGLMELPRPEEAPSLPKPRKNKLLTIKKRSIGNQAIEERIYEATLPQEINLDDCPDLFLMPVQDLDTVTLSAPHRKWVKDLLASQ